VETLADWTGELANQLLGRIKRKLNLYGVDISLSTPVVFAGKQFNHFPQHGTISRTHGFNHELGPIEVELQVIPEADFELSELVESSGTSLAEGEVSLF
jgi:CheY-specific phosphatase CheX